MRARYLPLFLFALGCERSVVDLDGRPREVTGLAALVFMSPGCPIANRYAPELTRIANRFAGRISWWLVYPDASADEARAHVQEYALAIPALRDPKHLLVKRAHVEVTPEAALLRDGALVWHGRIDDRFLDISRERLQATTHDLEDAVAAFVDGKPLPQPQPAVGCAIERR
jgi:hypothetical protein